jgi:hypothetical protein
LLRHEGCGAEKHDKGVCYVYEGLIHSLVL